MEDLEHLKSLHGKTMDLISFTLQLATNALDLPHHSPNDVFSGKVDVIFQIIVELMNVSIPKLNQRDRNLIEQRINKFYQLNTELEELQSDKPDLTALSEMNVFLQREFQLKVDSSEVEDVAMKIESLKDGKHSHENVNLDHRMIFAMNEKQYEKLCVLIDDTVNGAQYLKIADLSSKTILINEKLLDLQSAISQSRDERDREVRLTTEARQFLLAQYMNHNFVPPQIPMTFSVGVDAVTQQIALTKQHEIEHTD